MSNNSKTKLPAKRPGLLNRSVNRSSQVKNTNIPNENFELSHLDPLDDDDNVFDSDLTSTNLLLTNQQLLLTNQQRLLSNQLRIMHQMGRLEKLINTVTSNMTPNQSECVPIQPRTSRRVPVRPRSPAFEQIDTLEQLVKFESQLKDPNYRDSLISKMSAICGEDGKQNGINCSYILVDHFFTRRFMTKCSWAGGSRNSDEGKIPFKIYLNTMSLFHTLVQKADKDCSMIHCQQFFKKVIKNSTRRNSCGTITRASRAKCRPRKMVYKKYNHSNTGESIHKELRTSNKFEEKNYKEEPSTNIDELSLHIDDSIEQHVDNDYYTDDTDIFVKTERSPSPQNCMRED